MRWRCSCVIFPMTTWRSGCRLVARTVILLRTKSGRVRKLEMTEETLEAMKAEFPTLPW